MKNLFDIVFDVLGLWSFKSISKFLHKLYLDEVVKETYTRTKRIVPALVYLKISLNMNTVNP